MQDIAPYGGQVTEILQQCCTDSYHEICMQACRSIQKLVEAVGMMLYRVSKHLMAAVMPMDHPQATQGKLAVSVGIG